MIRRKNVTPLVTDQLVSAFTQAQRFLLILHHNPDGDTIASSLALLLALTARGKEVTVICSDIIPHQFQFLPLASSIGRDFPLAAVDAVVTLDCGDSKRTGFRRELLGLAKKNSTCFINIDHHPKNDLHTLARWNLVDYQAPATAYLVHQLIRKLGVRLNYKIATCLLTGLYTDTGGFKHPNTTPETLQLASTLLACGARLKMITTNIAQPTTVGRLKLWGTALSRIHHHPTYNMISTYITHRDILATQTQEADIGGIAALLASIPAEVAILVVQNKDGTIQVRMRTKNSALNLVPLATYLGGGGQKKAAGFALKGRLPI